MPPKLRDALELVAVIVAITVVWVVVPVQG